MNPYGTHLKYLESYIKTFKPLSVFEFGCGENSTPLFIEKCQSVISVEMQKPDWFLKIWEAFNGQSNFTLYCMPGGMGAPDYLQKCGGRFDMIFCDGHMASRWLQITEAAKKTNVIFTHDTDQPCYKWEQAKLSYGWKWFDFREVKPWTSVISNKQSVQDWARLMGGVLR